MSDDYCNIPIPKSDEYSYFSDLIVECTGSVDHSGNHVSEFDLEASQKEYPISVRIIWGDEDHHD